MLPGLLVIAAMMFVSDISESVSSFLSDYLPTLTLIDETCLSCVRHFFFGIICSIRRQTIPKKPFAL